MCGQDHFPNVIPAFSHVGGILVTQRGALALQTASFELVTLVVGTAHLGDPCRSSWWPTPLTLVTGSKVANKTG